MWSWIDMTPQQKAEACRCACRWGDDTATMAKLYDATAGEIESWAGKFMITQYRPHLGRGSHRNQKAGYFQPHNLDEMGVR